MKLLHFADLHLGMENFGRLNPSTGVHSRLLDFLDSLDQIVELALTKNVDAVLFAGDAYKTRDPSPTAVRELAKRLHKITKAGIPVVMLVGNHDVPNAEGRANTLDVFAALEIDGLIVSRKPETLSVSTRSGPLSIVTLPWVNPSLFLGRQPEITTDALLEEQLLQEMDHLWQSLLEQAAELNQPTVALVHGAIEGAAYHGNISIFKGSDLPLPKSWFINPSLSYTAAGHLHRYQVLATEPPVVYSGSPNYVDWSEEHDQKGVVLLDVDQPGQPARFQPVALKVRPLETIRVVLLGDDPTQNVLSALEGQQLEDKVVRLVLEGTPKSRKLLDERPVRQKLRQAYYSSGIIWELHKPEDMKKRSRNLADRSDEELIRLYCERKQMSIQETEAFLHFFESLRKEPAL